ncbi:MAG TPA: hypothetical protein VEU32_09235 [Burkholderiales bacterium]|nr:hypothetical protein [Burkholderiales bacterium]
MKIVLRLAALALVFGAIGARADNYPAGLIAEQLEQAGRAIDVDLTRMQPGDLESVEYVGRPVYVYRRTPSDRRALTGGTPAALVDAHSAGFHESVHAAYGSSASLVWARLLLVDQPALEKRRLRSYRDEYLVVGGWSPRSGCKLQFHPPTARARNDMVFTDSCRGTGFDAAGHALRGTGTGAPEFNLYLPPHRFIGARKLAIGLAQGKPPPPLDFSPAALYREDDETHNLIIAARYDDRARVDAALARGADVNAFRDDDGSPLDAAILGSPIETVKLLIERGARPTGRSMRAALFVGREEVWQLLEGLEAKEGSR